MCLIPISASLPGCASSLADVVFVLDSSGSIRDNNPQDGSYDNWNLLLTFVADVVTGLSIGLSATRVGIVTFSDTGDNLFYLNTYGDVNSMRSAILATSYVGSNTNTAAGIREMHYTQFTPNNGDRIGIQNFAIIITDGVSTTNNETTIPEAQAAINDGIRVFSVGITNNVNVNELKGMSTIPQIEGQTYWRSADFTKLGDIVDALVTETCATPAPNLAPTPAPTSAPTPALTSPHGNVMILHHLIFMACNASLYRVIC